MIPPAPLSYVPEGPRPLVREIAQSAAYPVERLGSLRSAVEAVQGMTQAPVAIPAASALAVASLLVQGFANVDTLGGLRPLSLYFLTIARSGERKSSCDAPFMSALRDHERQQAHARDERHAKWLNEHALWKGERDKLIGSAKKFPVTDKHFAKTALDALGPEPGAPPRVERTVSEPTLEGLTRLYATGLPSLGIFSDEGGQFLGGHGMNSENRQKTQTGLNDLWHGNPIRRTRAGDGQVTLFGRRLAMHLMAQPLVARRFTEDRIAIESGFLPRFLVCEPPSTIGKRFHANSRGDSGALREFQLAQQRILNTPMPMDEGTRELTPRNLPLSPEAHAHLVFFSDAIEGEQIPGGKFAQVTGYASKAAEQAARIAGVLALWRDLNAPQVTVGDMEDGCALAWYYLNEAVRLHNAASISEEIDRAEALRIWLRDNWEHPEIMMRDVVRCGPNQLRESPKARAALCILENHDWLVPLEPGTLVRGSVRKEAWRVIRRCDDAG